MRINRQCFASVLLALLPLTALIRVPFLSIGLGTVSLFVLLILLPLFTNLSIRFPKKGGILFLLLFCIYSFIRYSGNIVNQITFLVLVLFFISTDERCVDSLAILKTITIVAVSASIIVFLQVIFHYLFGLHMVVIPSFLLTEKVFDLYSEFIKTSVSEGLYRPSAFFLEPAHFSQYCITALICCLFYKPWKRSLCLAVIISFGIFLTTSGMGIAMVLLAWFFFVVLFLNIKSTKSIIEVSALGFFLAIIIVVLLQIPFFQKAMERVTGNVNGYNAFKGRLFYWEYFFSEFSANNYAFGIGGAKLEADKYMTGLMVILYTSGFIGLILFYGMVFQGFRVRNRYGKMISIYFSIMVVFSGITNLISMMFYLSLIRYISMDNSLIKNAGHSFFNEKRIDCRRKPNCSSAY